MHGNDMLALIIDMHLNEFSPVWQAALWNWDLVTCLLAVRKCDIFTFCLSTRNYFCKLFKGHIPALFMLIYAIEYKPNDYFEYVSVSVRGNEICR